jgi:hypothetical protein
MGKLNESSGCGLPPELAGDSLPNADAFLASPRSF